jgi:hypothetical protein
LKKLRVQWLAAAAVLLPIGVAVAEVAGEGSTAVTPAGAVQELVQSADKVARKIAQARAQLATAAAAAQKKQDLLLHRCLVDKLETVAKLQAKAAAPLAELQRATDPAPAQRPFVVVTVIGQKVARTMQEAAACVDSQNRGSGVALEDLEPPAAPEPDDDIAGDDLGTSLDPSTDLDALPLPPRLQPTETDFDPSTDPPPPASPMR